MDKYIFITGEGDPLAIAHRLKHEGKTVRVGVLEEPPSEMDKPVKERRDCLYDGMIEIESGELLIEEMASFPDKDQWFVMFDYGDLWPWSERVLEMGFAKGIFPTEEGYNLEKDRKASKALVKKHYPELQIAPAQEFKSVDDAIAFLEENQDKIYVLKSEGSEAETVVPNTDDPEMAHLQLVGALEAEAQDYEKGGFTLEEKIRHPIEISPVMLFWDGKPLFSLVEFENKPLGAGNIGRLTGGCQNLTLLTPLDCKLNQIAFPGIIHEMASNQPGIGIYDAGLLYNPNDEQFYFTEFCSQRWGWDGIFSELAMCGNVETDPFVSRHFDTIAEGRNPIVKRFGAAVRMFQTQPCDKEANVYQDGYSMDWKKEAEPNLFFYCIRKSGDNGEARFESVGYRKDLGVSVGSSDYMEAAVDEAYYGLKSFVMTGAYYRPRFDFLSQLYHGSIMNRYRWLINSGMIE